MMKKNKNQEIKKRVLIKNFYNENSSLVNLRELNTDQLELLLTSKNLIKEARLFKREQIDGMGFIVLFTEEEGEEILRNDVKLSFKRINRLKEIYKQIFLFRFYFGKDFYEDEHPL